MPSSPSSPRSALLRLARLLPVLLAAAVPLAAVAGSFGVSPIRIELGAQARTGAITVTNDDAAALRTQIRLVQWSQDDSGKDVYTPSEELVFFPRLMTMGSNEQRLVRVGLRGPALEREKTYRLFIEELPPPPEPGADGASRVAIAVSFGVPIFLRPAQEQPAGVIERLELGPGKLLVRVRNTGNVHFRISAISARGDGGFAAETAGWYLLAGAAREYELPIDARQCAQLQRLSVLVATDRTELRGELPVDPSKCGD